MNTTPNSTFTNWHEECMTLLLDELGIHGRKEDLQAEMATFACRHLCEQRIAVKNGMASERSQQEQILAILACLHLAWKCGRMRRRFCFLWGLPLKLISLSREILRCSNPPTWGDAVDMWEELNLNQDA